MAGYLRIGKTKFVTFNTLQSAMEIAFQFARTHVNTAANVQKRNYNVNLKEREYDIGDWV